MNNSQKYVSVVITTHNRSQKLKNAINSVLNQSYKFFEIIVVDDFSTDNTEKLIKNEFKNVIYYKNKKNLGVSDSRNIGVKLSNYEYIAFLDDDDEWLKNKLEMQINEMCLGNYDFSFSQFFVNQKIVPDSSLIDNNFLFKSALTSPILSPSTLICKKNVLLEVGLFNTSIKCFEDYDLSLRLTKNYTGKFIPLGLTIVNISENSLSSDSNALEGLKTRTKLFIDYYDEIKAYKLEKIWLRGLSNFQYFLNKKSYTAIISKIEKLIGFSLDVEKEYIKTSELDRAVPFSFFDSFDKPFWSVTSKINVDSLVKFCKTNKHSFYGVFSYIILKSCNTIKNFRLRKEGDYIFDYKNLQAQFTVLTKNKNADITRRIKLTDFYNFLDEFNHLKFETYNECIPKHHLEIFDDVVFLSCIPWFEFSHLEPVINYKWKDYIPRITWGMYYKIEDEFYIDISFTVHHSFIDGYHINLLLSEISNQVNLLTKKIDN